MMSEQLVTASKPDYNVIPVQLSAEEFEKFILPHLSLPKRGPQCKIGYHKPFNYILKVLYTGVSNSHFGLQSQYFRLCLNGRMRSSESK